MTAFNMPDARVGPDIRGVTLWLLLRVNFPRLAHVRTTASIPQASDVIEVLKDFAAQPQTGAHTQALQFSGLSLTAPSAPLTKTAVQRNSADDPKRVCDALFDIFIDNDSDLRREPRWVHIFHALKLSPDVLESTKKHVSFVVVHEIDEIGEEMLITSLSSLCPLLECHKRGIST